MKKKILLTGGLALSLLLLCSNVQAQATGSSETLTGIGIAGDYTTSSQTVYIGPGDYIVNGTWDIYAQNVWISPDAIISGTGTIRFYNPSDAGGTNSATLIDGNNGIHALDVKALVNNTSGVALTQIVKDGTLTGWSDSTSSSSLLIGNELNLATSGANVTLGNGVKGDLIFDADATISGYAGDRFVVTNNSILNHVVKQQYTGAFVFPVGIAAGDYTPVTVNNTIANAFSVSVQDYDQSASEERNTRDGVDRTWNIFAGNASGNSMLTLQHNFSSEQNQFNQSTNFITQYGPVAPNMSGDGVTNVSYSKWQSNQLQVPVIVGTTSSLSKAYTNFGISATDPLSFFSKSSNVAQPLPVELISFSGTVNDCKVSLNWETGEEEQISGYEVQYSTDGSRFTKVGTVKATHKADGNKYDFAHMLTASKGYYRLSIPVNNAGYKYSNTISLTGSCFTGITLSPNPTSGYLQVIGVQAGDVVSVHSITGQLLLTQTTTSDHAQIDLRNYPGAIYQVTILRDDQMILNTRIIKKD